MRILYRGALFTVLPVLFVEILVRGPLSSTFDGVRTLEDFYKPVRAHVDTTRIDYLFVGSSRVAAAVDASAFAEAISPAVRVLNAGQGYSTPAIHTLAIMDLIERHPEQMSGVTIFVEAPMGVPDPQTWDDPWHHPEWPSLLASVLDVEDVATYVLVGGTLSEKAFVLAAKLSRTVWYWRYLRSKATGTIDALGNRPLRVEDQADLISKGGIRTDSMGIALAREKARAVAEEIAEQRPVKDWDDVVWACLVRHVREVGGDVVFFETPLSSIQRRAYETPIRQRDRASFARWIRDNCIRFVPLQGAYADEDFPDVWHLGRQHSPSYTRALASAFSSR